MDPKGSDFQDLLHTHVLNLRTEDHVDNNSDNSEVDDAEIIENSESEHAPFFEEEETNDISVPETPIVDASLNPNCLLLCGRILRIMGDEITCKACGKHLRSIGDEIFSAYAFKKSINALLQDLSYREGNQSPVC